jgi:hypothetical protein
MSSDGNSRFTSISINSKGNSKDGVGENQARLGANNTLGLADRNASNGISLVQV